MIPMKLIDPSPSLRAYVADLKATIGKHKHLSPDEMLAGAAQLVGNLVALQDQRKMTPDMAMQVVASNIEVGNQQVISDLMQAPHGVPRDIIQEGLGRRDITKKPK